MDAAKPFLSIPEFGQLLGMKRARAYVVARELGIAVQVSQRRWLVPRAAVEALEAAAVERAREIGPSRPQ